MSSSVSVPIHYDGQNERESVTRFVDNTSQDVDQAVLLRMTRLSLFTGSPPDNEENSSQGATDVVGSLDSTPPSPIPDSDTSFDVDRDSLGDNVSSLSPAPSLYSLTESLKEQAVRSEYGREVNTHSDVYKLAADEEEALRLDKQHRLYQVVFGDYAPPFREILEDNGDPLRPKACLDIGCGSGAWILEVANAFPHVSCTAVDLVPLPAIIPSLIERIQIPSNLRFEIDDVSLGLEHFAGDFDVVHVKHISSGIRDYYRLISDVAITLRPRGLADFIECDWRLYDVDKQPLISTRSEIWGAFEPPEGWMGRGMARSGTSPVRGTVKARESGPTPYPARFGTLLRQAAIRRGGHVDSAALLHRWISEHPAYEDVVYRDAWLPLGEWLDNIDVRNRPELNSLTAEEFARLRWIGKECSEDFIGLMRATRPLLLSTGVPEALVDDLTSKAAQELHDSRTPLYLRTQNVYARKKERRQDTAALLLSQ